MPLNVRVLGRKVHRWVALLTAGPFLVVLVSGLLLQVKKQVAWVQPPTTKGTSKQPRVGYDALLTAVMSVPEAEVSSWADIDRVDYRPRDGVAKVQCKNRWEVQVDVADGTVRQTAYRRSDLIESFHDGSWFGDGAKLYVFLPAAGGVLVLWLTGAYLWALPNAVRWRSQRSKSGSSKLPVLPPKPDTPPT